MSQYYSNNYRSPAPPGPAQGGSLCGGAVGCCLLIGGMTQVLLGILAIAFGAVIYSTEVGWWDVGSFEWQLHHVHYPLWGGAIFIITGAIGMSSLCCPSFKTCMAVTYITLCVIAALTAVGMSGCEAWVASLYFGSPDKYYCDILDNFGPIGDDLLQLCDDFRLVYRLILAVSVIGGVEFIVAIVGAIFGCMYRSSDNANQLNNIMIVAGQNQFAPDPYAQNAAYAQTPSTASYPQMSMSSYPNETVRTSYSASNYMQSPTPAPYYNGYGPNPKVHYNGQRATYQPSRYM